MNSEMRKALGTLTDCQLIHVVSEIMSYDYQFKIHLQHSNKTFSDIKTYIIIIERTLTHIIY